jgi:predicted SprT family Zn-dependent metalloprotease
MSLTTTEVEQYARMTLKQHGFADHSVVFLPRLTRRLGQANPWQKRIELSPRCLASFPLFKYVLLHELAHIIQFYRMGKTYKVNGRNAFHNHVFKQACRELKIPTSRRVPLTIWRKSF